MSVEVIAIGGYEEVGKNMTAICIGEDVIITLYSSHNILMIG